MSKNIQDQGSCFLYTFLKLYYYYATLLKLLPKLGDSKRQKMTGDQGSRLLKTLPKLHYTTLGLVKIPSFQVGMSFGAFS